MSDELTAARERVRVLETEIRDAADALQHLDDEPARLVGEALRSVLAPQVIDLAAALKASIANADERDRLRAELAAAKKQAAEDFDVIAKAAELNARKDRELAAANEEIARLAKFLDARNVEIEQFDVKFLGQYARLGRAVAALQWLLNRADDVETGPLMMEECRRIAADADGTQAAAYVSALEAVYEAARVIEPDGYGKIRTLLAAVAAVDARRGAVKP